MPKKRQPVLIWRESRKKILARDKYACVRCGLALTIATAQIDHIISGKCGTNALSNLRTLCRRCHVLRNDHRHRGMIAKALKDGVIGPNWRSELWE